MHTFCACYFLCQVVISCHENDLTLLRPQNVSVRNPGGKKTVVVVEVVLVHVVGLLFLFLLVLLVILFLLLLLLLPSSVKPQLQP